MPTKKGRRAEPPDATLPSLTADQIAQVERAWVRTVLPGADVPTPKGIAATVVPVPPWRAVAAHLRVEKHRLAGLRTTYQAAHRGEMRTLCADLESDGREAAAGRAVARLHLSRALALVSLGVVEDAEQADSPSARAKVTRTILDASNALAKAEEPSGAQTDEIPDVLRKVLTRMADGIDARKDAESAAAADTAGAPTGEPPLPPRDDPGAA